MELKTVNDVVTWISESQFEDCEDVADAFLKNKVDGAFLRNMCIFLNENESGFYNMLRNKFDILHPCVLRDVAEILKAWYAYEQKRLKEKEIIEEKDESSAAEEEEEEEEDEVFDEILPIPSDVLNYKAIVAKNTITSKMAEDLKNYVNTLKLEYFSDLVKRAEIKSVLRKLLSRTFFIKEGRFMKKDKYYKIQFRCRCEKCVKYDRLKDFPKVPFMIDLKFAENESFGQLMNMHDVTKFICSQ